MDVEGKWSNVVGSNVSHYFVGMGQFSSAICNYSLIPRDGWGIRHCKRCEKAVIAENKRREKESHSRRELLERIDKMNNTEAFDRLIELVGDAASEWGISRDDSIEREELERNIRYRLTYYVHGEE